MSRQTLLVVIIGICVVNGIFSPLIAIARPIAAVWMPDFIPRDASWVFYFSSLFVSSATLLFGGVPAALYERTIDSRPESLVSMYIWLAVVILLSLPALALLGYA